MDVEINRIINAPRQLVFDAWTDPDKLAQWYAPYGCTITVKKFELKQGGQFLHCIYTPGFDCWCMGEFLEVDAPNKLVYTLNNCDEDGNPVTPAVMGKDDDWPMKTTVTVTFTEQDGKTAVYLHQTVDMELAKKTGAYPSWLQMLDRLEEIIK